METRVHKLCRAYRIWSTATKEDRKGAGKTPRPAVNDDLVQRKFTMSARSMGSG
jgi:putative transposase